MKDCVKGLEMYPHRGSRIGQPSVTESISGKEIPEFIMNDRLGDREKWQQCRTQRQRQKSYENQRETAPSAEFSNSTFDVFKPVRPQSWAYESEDHGHNYQGDFYPQHVLRSLDRFNCT
jgi:hypothetical protein